VVPVPEEEISCRDCHTEGGEGGRLGRFDNKDYCGITWLALLSEKRTMPSKAPHVAGLLPPETHLKAIADRCRDLTPRLNWDLRPPAL